MDEFFDGDAIKASRYFQKFKNLQELFPNAMSLKGDNVLVEKLPPVEMKTSSGIIISNEVHTHKGTMGDALTEFGLVLMVGPGQYFDDGTQIECSAKPGDIILLPSTTYWYSQFGHIAGYKSYSIGRTRDSQIPMWFGDYQQAFRTLNA